MLTDEQMYERMQKGWRGGLHDGTVCGVGSTMGNTGNVRRWLPQIAEDYGIRFIADAGAGDRHWIRMIFDWPVGTTIFSFDLIPRTAGVQRLDITSEVIPMPVDAILCRHVLNHLDDGRVQMALARFNESSAKWLIATQFDHEEPGEHREFTRLNLRKYLGEPVEFARDGGAAGCLLALWKLH